MQRLLNLLLNQTALVWFGYLALHPAKHRVWPKTTRKSSVLRRRGDPWGGGTLWGHQGKGTGQRYKERSEKLMELLCSSHFVRTLLMKVKSIQNNEVLRRYVHRWKGSFPGWHFHGVPVTRLKETTSTWNGRRVWKDQGWFCKAHASRMTNKDNEVKGWVGLMKKKPRSRGGSGWGEGAQSDSKTSIKRGFF